MSYRSTVGRYGEELAAKYLQNHGYNIITRNYKVYNAGEIDIIAEIEDTLVFVEVKTRSTLIYGTPAEAVTKFKMQRIVTAAEAFIQATNAENKPARVDVIEVLIDEENDPVINHLTDVLS